MARTSTRRWKGCAMCKDHKHAGHGDATRTPVAAMRRVAGRTRRWSRNEIEVES